MCPFTIIGYHFAGFSSKESACNAGATGNGFDPCVRKIPCRRAWQPTPVSLPGESHGQRSLVGCSPWSLKESDTTERLSTHACVPRSVPGERDLQVLHPGLHCPLASCWLCLIGNKDKRPKRGRRVRLSIYCFVQHPYGLVQSSLSFLFPSGHPFCTALFCLQPLLTAVSSPLGLEVVKHFINSSGFGTSLGSCTFPGDLPTACAYIVNSPFIKCSSNCHI